MTPVDPEPDVPIVPGGDPLPGAIVGSCLSGCGIDGSKDPIAAEGGAPPVLVRVGQGIRPPTKRRHVNPVYPDLALRAHLRATVVVECVIDTAGRVADVRVVRGHPLFDAAALEAVRQWVYSPTLLNGTPVAVALTVTVRFDLAR